MESVEYEPAWSVGAFCGNDDIAATVAYLIDRANDYGFDAIEIGTVLAMYMEYTQKGYANGAAAWPGATRTAWSRWPARSRSAKA